MRLAIFHSLFLGASIFGQGSPPRDPVAVVLEMYGSWSINGKPAPTPPIDLYDKDALVLNRDEKTGSVKIMNMDGTLSRCALPQCARVDIVRPIQPQTSIFSRVLAALAQAVLPARENYVPARVRGGLVADGIGLITGGSIQIKPARDSAKVERILQFTRYRSNGKLEEPVLNKVNWMPGRAVAAPGINPGLYRVTILRKDDRPSEGFFLLLVVDSANPKGVDEEFDTFVAATKVWLPEDQGDAAAALRLYLWGKAKLLLKQ